ncbi:uncharacterized protein LOC100552136 [Anolis carolinensis]|uniref:uncharacterized protein LOC100552136 n=1 Tax=Anolis carolinensis TaxID=28377 RepID=UPI002F2B6F8D
MPGQFKVVPNCTDFTVWMHSKTQVGGRAEFLILGCASRSKMTQRKQRKAGQRQGGGREKEEEEEEEEAGRARRLALRSSLLLLSFTPAPLLPSLPQHHNPSDVFCCGYILQEGSHPKDGLTHKKRLAVCSQVASETIKKKYHNICFPLCSAVMNKSSDLLEHVFCKSHCLSQGLFHSTGATHLPVCQSKWIRLVGWTLLL